jgi:acetyl-CoA carboxylase carboxyl transferase subunit alpha
MGAYPGLDAEERGQSEAIARNITEMARIEVPIISIVTGEGGSGGALGIGVGDVVLMLSHAIYSVISPEGCASILWRDAAYNAQAAEAMKITAKSLLELRVIDEIIPEPSGGAHTDYIQTAETIKAALLKYLKRMTPWTSPKLISRRFDKYAAMGQFSK